MCLTVKTERVNLSVTRQLRCVTFVWYKHSSCTPKIRTMLARDLYGNDRAGTAQACAKIRDFEPPYVPATDLEIRQHLIFSS